MCKEVLHEEGMGGRDTRGGGGTQLRKGMRGMRSEGSKGIFMNINDFVHILLPLAWS